MDLAKKHPSAEQKNSCPAAPLTGTTQAADI